MLVDAYQRPIKDLRISVTDRCNFRCSYCMPLDHYEWIDKKEILTFEEISRLAKLAIELGVEKIRLTGGEPLVRRDVSELAHRLGCHVGTGLDELTMTTNGNRLAEHAERLVDAGMRRINVSLDSRDPDRFRHITRHGDVARVLGGIDAAARAGLAIKINMVALKGFNEDEIAPMLAWCVDRGFDLTLIETMPLGAIDEERIDRFLPLTAVMDDLQARFPLARDAHRSGGPARYWRVEGTGTKLGLISPLTGNFCDTCNRVRLTTEGVLFTCLGHDDKVDLKAALRDGGIASVDAAIDAAMATKPARHDFDIAAARPAVARHMSVTGG